MSPTIVTALAAVMAGAAGLLVPRMIRDLPPHQEETISYREVAHTPGLVWWSIGLCAAAGAVLGAVLGWSWVLLPPLLVVAPCVALAVVDARTHLLPTRIVAPTGLVTAIALGIVAIATRDLDVAVRGLGGLAAGLALFWALWRFTRGMGFGDVRLAGVLGMLLAAHSWNTLAIGLYAAFILAALSIPIRRLLSSPRTMPFGPFLTLGAWTALVISSMIRR